MSSFDLESVMVKAKSGPPTILPTIPTVAIRLLEALSNPDVPTGDIIKLVQTDPAITAKLAVLRRRPKNRFPGSSGGVARPACRDLPGLEFLAFGERP
jgi:hypothetical protein